MAATVLTMTGCSTSADPDSDSGSDPESSRSAQAADSSRSPAAKPSATKASAFCLDLDAYQVGVVVFRADVAKAAQGQQLDIKGLRQRFTMISLMGEEMKASAPPDVADEFRTVRKALATSAGRLREGTQVRDVVGPLFGERVNSAFDAVNDYECDSKSEPGK